MIRPVSHPATGRLIDIAAALPGEIAFLAELHDELPDSHDHGLICETAGGSDKDRQVYVYKHDGTYSCRHFPGHGHHGNHDVTPESEAHKRGKDYGLGALDREGIQAGTEISSNRRTRSDVVGFGSVVTAVEIQASPGVKPSRIKARDTRARRATAIITPGFARNLTDGINPVWAQIHDGPADWLHQVPSIRSSIRYGEWAEHMPKPGTVGAAGVRSIDPEPCRAGSQWDHCPVTGRGYCGSWHPFASVRTGLTLDDVFVQAASGLLVPFRYHTGYVYLTDPASVALDAELGGAGAWEPGVPAARKYGVGPCRYWIHPAQDERERTRPVAATTIAGRPVSRRESLRAEAERLDQERAEREELLAEMREQERQRLARALRTRDRPPLTQPHVVQSCSCPACGNPAQLWPGGWWCSNHPCRDCQCDPRRAARSARPAQARTYLAKGTLWPAFAACKPEFWDDRKLAKRTSRDARLLYIALWNLADEWGRLNGDPQWIKGQVFSYDDDLNADAIGKLLEELENPALGCCRRLRRGRRPVPVPAETRQASAAGAGEGQ